MKINSALLPLFLQCIILFFIMMLNFDKGFIASDGDLQLSLVARERSFTSFIVAVPSFILFLLQNMIALKAKKDENRGIYRLYATLSMFLFIGVFTHLFQANCKEESLTYIAYIITTGVLCLICLYWKYIRNIKLKDFEETKTEK